jgi:hypothetical protein
MLTFMCRYYFDTSTRFFHFWLMWRKFAVSGKLLTEKPVEHFLKTCKKLAQ